LPAWAGAKAFQVEISPLRLWRKVMVVCSACCTAWKITSCFNPSKRADAGRRRRAEMRDVIHLVLMQADGAYQIHLDLVAGRDAADQVAPGLLHRLRDGQDRRDVVAGCE
jgi:hypothetical protein